MKTHDFLEEWPPFQEGFLAQITFRESQKFGDPDFRSVTGKRIVFWTIENNQIVWKDSFSKNQIFDVDITKWWHLCDLDKK